MDFELTETQRELIGLTRQIADEELTPQRRTGVEAEETFFDRALWRALAAAGVLGAALPETVGGGGLDFLELCAVQTEMGRAVAPVPYLTHVTSAQALAYFGTDEQRTRWAGPAAHGEVVLAAALAEEFDAAGEHPATRATADGAGWHLDGGKVLVPFGAVADALLVSAASERGIQLFVVLPSDPGVTLAPQRLVDGDTAVSLDLADVPVAADRLVPGADVVHWLVARTTIGLAAYQVGVVERALELTAAYARERQQFGRPIGSFQAVGQRLADAYIDVEAARLTMWEAAWRIAEPLPAAAEIATAAFWAAEAGHRVAHTAVHVHGGAGIDLDAPTHRYFTAAKRTEFALGGATAQLRALGTELAATPA